MILYKATLHGELIQEIEVIRANEKSYWTMGFKKEQRSARYNEQSSYFDTKEQAKQYLEGKIKRNINNAESNLSRQKQLLLDLEKY